MDDEARATRRKVLQLLFHYITLFVGILVTGTTSLLLSESLKVPQAYHTSLLTGEGWVRELQAGHPERIRCELGVHSHVFLELIEELHRLGHRRSKYVSLEEQLAIFLYICVTGMTIRHTGERFQRSNETISRQVICFIFSLILFDAQSLAISDICFVYSPHIHFTPDMSFCLLLTIQSRLRSTRIPNFGLTSRTRSVHWTAVTSTVRLPQYSDHPIETAKAAFLRTVCLRVRLTCSLFMPIRGGRDPQRMHEFTRVLFRMGLIYPPVNTIWRMPAFPLATSF